MAHAARPRATASRLVSSGRVRARRALARAAARQPPPPPRAAAASLPGERVATRRSRSSGGVARSSSGSLASSSSSPSPSPFFGLSSWSADGGTRRRAVGELDLFGGGGREGLSFIPVSLARVAAAPSDLEPRVRMVRDLADRADRADQLRAPRARKLGQHRGEEARAELGHGRQVLVCGAARFRGGGAAAPQPPRTHPLLAYLDVRCAVPLVSRMRTARRGAAARRASRLARAVLAVRAVRAVAVAKSSATMSSPASSTSWSAVGCSLSVRPSATRTCQGRGETAARARRVHTHTHTHTRPARA